ncbi:MAG: serine hydrolase [Pseudomonadota bacterium]
MIDVTIAPKRIAACVALLGWVPHALVAETMEEEIRRAFDAGALPGLHAVVAIHNDDLIGEVYFAGEDERWGEPIGIVEHGPDTLHDIRSVTKSIVGLLYGIAMDEGLVPDIDAPLLEQFPSYADLKDGTARDNITIRDTLTMQMGTEWDESLPYTDPRNSEIAMELAEDRYRFVLERPMVATPGTEWSYSGGAVALIGKLIADRSGMPLDEFAESRLFTPLGINHFEWIRGSDGVPSAASGLRLTARDLAKIGQVIANDGVYSGTQVIPKDWLAASSEPAAKIEDGFSYGLLWYLAQSPSDDPIIIALGNGGQRLTIQPSAGLVVVSLAGRYNDWSVWQLGVDVLVDHVIPAVNSR